MSPTEELLEDVGTAVNRALAVADPAVDRSAAGAALLTELEELGYAVLKR